MRAWNRVRHWRLIQYNTNLVLHNLRWGLCIIQYAVCVQNHCVPWWFWPKTHALLKICIITLCIMSKSTVLHTRSVLRTVDLNYESTSSQAHFWACERTEFTAFLNSRKVVNPVRSRIWTQFHEELIRPRRSSLHGKLWWSANRQRRLFVQ